MDLRALSLLSIFIYSGLCFGDIRSKPYEKVKTKTVKEEIILCGENSSMPEHYSIVLNAVVETDLMDTVFYERKKQNELPLESFLNDLIGDQSEEFLAVLRTEDKRTVIKIDMPELPLLRGEKESIKVSWDGLGKPSISISNDFIKFDYILDRLDDKDYVLKILSVKRKMDAIPSNTLVLSCDDVQSKIQCIIEDPFHDEKDRSITTLFYKVKVDRHFLPKSIKHTVETGKLSLDKQNKFTTKTKFKSGSYIKVCYYINKSGSDKFNSTKISDELCTNSLQID